MVRLSESLTDERVLTWLTERAIDYRERKGWKGEMGRLEDKLAQVAGAADRVIKSVEARADRVLEREPKLIKRSNAIFDVKDSLLDDAEKGLDRVERSLGLLTNFDPSDASGKSQEEGPEASSAPLIAGSIASVEPGKQ